MGREQWFLTPKDGISLLGIRSKIERQGVLKERNFRFSLFLFLRIGGESEQRSVRVVSFLGVSK